MLLTAVWRDCEFCGKLKYTQKIPPAGASGTLVNTNKIKKKELQNEMSTSGTLALAVIKL